MYESQFNDKPTQRTAHVSQCLASMRNLLIVFICLVPLPGCHYWKNEPVDLKQGHIDLRSWNARSPQQLQGEALLFWDQLLSPAEVFAHIESKSPLETVKIPNNFSDLTKKKDFSGVATYAIHLSLLGHPYDLVYAEYQVRPKATLKAQCRQGSQLSRTTIALTEVTSTFHGTDTRLRTNYLRLPTFAQGNQECIITIGIKNSKAELWSGLWYAGTLQSMPFKKAAEIYFLSGLAIMLGMMLYVLAIHLSHWIRNAKAWVHPFICLVAIGSIVRVLIWTNLNQSIREMINFEILPLDYYSETLLIAANLIGIGGLGFIRQSFPYVSRSRLLQYIHFGLWSLLFLLLIWTPFGINSAVQEFTFYLLMSMAAVTLIYTSICVFKGEPNAKTIVAGYTIWIASAMLSVHVTFTENDVIPVYDLFGLAVLLLCLSQTVAARHAAVARQNLQLLEEIKEKERARNMFFQNSSHELRTPLNGIIGYLDLVMRSETSSLSPKVLEYARKIRRLSLSLRDQVNTILDIAQGQRGEQTLNLSQISLEDFKDDCDKLAKGFQLKYATATYQSDLIKEETIGLIKVDRDKLIAIVRSLLNNAFKFSKPGRGNHVCLLIKADRKRLSLIVSDEGIGIAAKQKQQIFEAFYQVAGDTRRPYEGAGLGLAISRDFINLMKGDINLQSELDVGSQFTVNIPIQSVQNSHRERTDSAFSQATTMPESHASEDLSTWASQEEPAGSSQKPTGSSKMHHVLVVDDHPDNAELLADVLSLDNYQVSIAHSGADALHMMQNQRPNLVLLDMMMPEISGEDVLRAIRQDEVLRVTPVILVTALSTQEDRLLGLKLGADDYLSKPIHADEVRLRVRNLLQRQSQYDLEQQMHLRYELSVFTELLTDMSNGLHTLSEAASNQQQISDLIELCQYLEAHLPKMVNHQVFPDSEPKTLINILRQLDQVLTLRRRGCTHSLRWSQLPELTQPIPTELEHTLLGLLLFVSELDRRKLIAPETIAAEVQASETSLYLRIRLKCVHQDVSKLKTQIYSDSLTSAGSVSILNLYPVKRFSEDHGGELTHEWEREQLTLKLQWPLSKIYLTAAG